MFVRRAYIGNDVIDVPRLSYHPNQLSDSVNLLVCGFAAILLERNSHPFTLLNCV